MTIDNFPLLSNYMEFAPDMFYWVQILKRRKENPDMSTGCRLVDNFYIDTLEDFQRYEPKIKEICEANNARAYIHVNRRSYTKVALRAARIIAEHIEAGQYKAVKNAYESACGQTHAEENKRWIVDIDHKDYVFDVDTYIYMKVPTVNGFHLVVAPFNLMMYKHNVVGFDIQKNHPTILYYKVK